jgi:mono/diheme cytochrome c family protein
MRSAAHSVTTLLSMLSLLACSGEGEPAAPPAPRSAAEQSAAPAPPPEPAAAATSATPVRLDPIEQGRRVYSLNCVVCHNADPRQDGAIGPSIAGSPRELVEARVMRAAYPAGHTPKRDTKLMMPLPHLEADIPALAAFLGAASSQ